MRKMHLTNDKSLKFILRRIRPNFMAAHVVVVKGVVRGKVRESEGFCRFLCFGVQDAICHFQSLQNDQQKVKK